ncbi:MAG TPA: lyase family protein [Jatrophihabitantaceae bacterium]
MSSQLFDGVFGTTAAVAATDDTAIVDALCEAETALARACTRAGVIELPVALEIAAACDEVRRIDPGDLGRRSVSGGNPVIPLVAELRARLDGTDAARAVHLGATSQDILDTALMLVASRAVGVLLADLDECGSAIARLAREHRDTPMSARTLLQQAVATSFGALAAVWGTGIDAVTSRLRTVRDALPVQLGGAAGTLAPLHPHGAEVRAAFADELDLADPQRVWHADRTPITELAGALGSAAAAVGKVAGDVVLLAQSEVGEVREGAPGGSSSMAHKQNAIAAVTARAAAAQAPGLVATLLAAGSPELQRGAGAWHAEWPALIALLRYTGGAASRLWVCLSGLSVEQDAMRSNLARLDGTVDIADLGHATDLVDSYLERRTP